MIDLDDMRRYINSPGHWRTAAGIHLDHVAMNGLCDELERLRPLEAGIEQMQLQIDKLSEENEVLKDMALIGALHLPNSLDDLAMESLAKTEIAREADIE